MNENRKELLEIYKLHAELADRVSQRRDLANRRYVGLLTGFLVFIAAGAGAGEVPDWIVIATSVFGALLSISWSVVIRSYRQLNTGKFKMLHELEDKIAYPAFRREWEILEKGKNKNKYRQLTVAEAILPAAFFLFFIISLVAYYFI